MADRIDVLFDEETIVSRVKELGKQESRKSKE